MKEDYTTYRPDDFVADHSFKSWVLNPNPEKDYYWRTWLTNHPEQSESVAVAREIILSVNFTTKRIPTAKKDALYADIINRSKTKEESLKLTKGHRSSYQWLKVAASVSLLLIAILVGILKFVQNDTFIAETGTEYIERETRRGEKLTLTLPDGTIVKMNALSKIKFPTVFGKSRDVELTGEAYFDVERNIHKPFLVRTGEITTRVLGTSFNVNHSSDQSVQVAVTSGKVAVHQNESKESYNLLPTELLTYKSNGFTKGYFDEEKLLGWKDWVLVFEDADIHEIAEKVSVWFDVDISVEGQQAVKRRFSGKFKNPSLKQVLEGISYTSKFDYTINQKKITIHLK